MGVLLLSTAAVLFLRDPSRAQACTQASCEDAVVAPVMDLNVPANLPGFPVSDEVHRYSPTDAGAPPPLLLELLDSQGNPVPLERSILTAEPADSLSPKVGGALFAPRAPLSPGMHKLRWQSQCGSPKSRERAITVLPASPLPTVAGTVRVAASQRQSYSVTASGSCYRSIDAALVRLELQPSAELAPFLPVARLTVMVDDRLWASSTYGGGLRVQPDAYRNPVQKPLEIFAECGASGGGDRFSEGIHQGKLHVEIPGAARPLPPIAFSFSFDCSGAAAAGDVDAGADSWGGQSNDAGAGCSIAGGPAGGLPWALLGLGLAVLVRRGRDRARKSADPSP